MLSLSKNSQNISSVHVVGYSTTKQIECDFLNCKYECINYCYFKRSYEKKELLRLSTFHRLMRSGPNRLSPSWLLVGATTTTRIQRLLLIHGFLDIILANRLKFQFDSLCFLLFDLRF
jgi:hypothetical protein